MIKYITIVALLAVAAVAKETGYDSCKGKDVGVSCKICDPNKKDCVETDEVKTCQKTENGLVCKAALIMDGNRKPPTRCDKLKGPASKDQSTCPKSACAKKKGCEMYTTYNLQKDGVCCSQPCNHKCPSKYNPCEGKDVGASCKNCDPNNTDCVETMEIKTCKKNMDDGSLVCKSGSADGNLKPPTKVCSKGCKSWFDGCNTCKCDAEGKIGGCTKKACAEKKEPKCLDKPQIMDGNLKPPTKVCPKGCKKWYDGCNSCTCDGVGKLGSCTEKACIQKTEAKCEERDAPVADGVDKPPVDGKVCPKGCKSWFDGCNTCGCDAEGKITRCTLKACKEKKETKCLDKPQIMDGNLKPPTQVCPKGCTGWFDGCNRCRCEGVGKLGACTEMACKEKKEPKCSTMSSTTCDKEKGPRVGSCPVARCMAPPEGCQAATVYEARNAGTKSESCCPKLCYYVDKDGKQCRNDRCAKECAKGQESSLRCMACRKGISPKEYCEHNPTVKGCKVTYNCNTRDLPELWAPDKKKWCCLKEKKGCEEAYNCMTKETWSKEKKAWCCKEKKLGCETNCFAKTITDEKTKKQCCEKTKLHCDNKPVCGGKKPIADATCEWGKGCKEGKCEMNPITRKGVCCPVDKKEKFCCKAMTLSCLACAADLSSKDYCAKTPKATVCRVVKEADEKDLAMAAYEKCKVAAKDADTKAKEACKANLTKALCKARGGDDTTCAPKPKKPDDKDAAVADTDVEVAIKEEGVKKLKEAIEACMKDAGKDKAKALACRKKGDAKYKELTGDDKASETDMQKKRDEASRAEFADKMKLCMAKAQDDASKAACKCDSYIAAMKAAGKIPKDCTAQDGKDDADVDAATDELDRKAKMDEVRKQMTACMAKLRDGAAKGTMPSKDDSKKCSDGARAAMDAMDGKDSSSDDAKDAITKAKDEADFKKTKEKGAVEAYREQLDTCMKNGMAAAGIIGTNGKVDPTKAKDWTARDDVYAKCREQAKQKYADARGDSASDIDDEKVNRAEDKAKTDAVAGTMRACYEQAKDAATDGKPDKDALKKCLDDAKAKMGEMAGKDKDDKDVKDDFKEAQQKAAAAEYAKCKTSCLKSAGGDAKKVGECADRVKKCVAYMLGKQADEVDDAEVDRARKKAEESALRDTQNACMDGKKGGGDTKSLCRETALNEFARINGKAPEEVDRTKFEQVREQSCAEGSRDHMNACMKVAGKDKDKAKACYDKMKAVVAKCRGEDEKDVSETDAQKNLAEGAKKEVHECLRNCGEDAKAETDKDKKMAIHKACSTKCTARYRTVMGKPEPTKDSDEERDSKIKFDQAKAQAARDEMLEALKNCKDADRKKCLDAARKAKEDFDGEDPKTADTSGLKFAATVRKMCDDTLKETIKACLNTGVKDFKTCETEGFKKREDAKCETKDKPPTVTDKASKVRDVAGSTSMERFKLCVEAGKAKAAAADTIKEGCLKEARTDFTKFSGKPERFANTIKAEGAKDAAKYMADCRAIAQKAGADADKQKAAYAKCKEEAKKKLQDTEDGAVDDKKFETKLKEGVSKNAVNDMSACIKEQKEAGAADLKAAVEKCRADAKKSFEKVGIEKYKAAREMLEQLLKKAAATINACKEAESKTAADCMEGAKTFFQDAGGKLGEWLRHAKRVLTMAERDDKGTPVKRVPKNKLTVDATLNVEGGKTKLCGDDDGAKEARKKVREGYKKAVEDSAKDVKVTLDQVRMTICGDKALVVIDDDATKRRRLRRLAAEAVDTSMEIDSDKAADVATAIGEGGTTKLNDALATSGTTVTGDVGAAQDFTEEEDSGAIVTVDTTNAGDGDDKQPGGGNKGVVAAASGAAPSMLALVACAAAAMMW